MMPPDYGNGEMPDFDSSRFESEMQQEAIWNFLDEYSIGSGASQDQWFDSITEIRDFDDWYDDEGEYHYSFEFDFDDGGSMTGTRSIVR